MINKKYSSQKFIEFLDTVNCTQEKKFYLTMKYSNKFFIYIQENNIFIRNNLSRKKSKKKKKKTKNRKKKRNKKKRKKKKKKKN